MGKHVCQDLGCKDEDFKTRYGRDPKHGETWCAEANGVSSIDLSSSGTIETDSNKENLPGSRYIRLVCYNGDVSIEPCADYRQEVCIQSQVNEFRTASCRVNNWRDCYSQENVLDCTNRDKRDCKVVEGVNILTDERGESLFRDENEEIIDASCVPLYTPGFNFWNEGGDAESFCSLASTTCVINYGAKLGESLQGGKGEVVPDEACVEVCKEEDGCGLLDTQCKKNCEDKCTADCVDEDGNLLDSWKDDMNEMCISLGDCGSSLNYLKKPGYYDEDGGFVRSNEDEED